MHGIQGASSLPTFNVMKDCPNGLYKCRKTLLYERRTNVVSCGSYEYVYQLSFLFIFEIPK